MTVANDSNLSNVTCLKYYKIEIDGLKTFLEVRQYHVRRYLCIFSMVNQSQVFNNPLYDSYGFSVIYDDHKQPRFLVNGTLTRKQAEEIWAQVSHKLCDADHLYTLNDS